MVDIGIDARTVVVDIGIDARTVVVDGSAGAVVGDVGEIAHVVGVGEGQARTDVGEEPETEKGINA